MSDPGLRVEGLSKEYPGTLALDRVTLAFRPGRVHALIGRNGAGKSTLVKVLSGAVRPTAGRIVLDGEDLAPRCPADAFARGVATVYQEMSLVPGLSVAENVLLGRLPRKRRLGLPVIDRRGARSRARSILEGLGVEMDVAGPVSRLDVAGRQAVEIAKAMSFEPRVLLLDEPTSALSHQGARGLFRLVRRLRERDVTVIYITHRLQELGEVADEVSVLRDGRLVGSLPVREATAAAIARMMFGEEVRRSEPAPRDGSGETVLEVRDLRAGHRLRGVSLSVEAGEVLGIAGTLGSGRTELLRAVFGADPVDGGEVLVAGRPVGRAGPAGMKRLGVGLTPENRKEEGLVQVLSVADNLCLAGLDRVSRLGVLDRRRQAEQVERNVRELRIAVTDTRRAVATLSGGNQQKVVLGNWLNTRPRVMLLDEPTRGIDVQAKQQVFSLVRDLSARGIATLFVSSELEELLEVCHRVLAMRHGRVVAEFPAAGLEMETLLAACLEEDAA